MSLRPSPVRTEAPAAKLGISPGRIPPSLGIEQEVGVRQSQGQAAVRGGGWAGEPCQLLHPSAHANSAFSVLAQRLEPNLARGRRKEFLKGCLLGPVQSLWEGQRPRLGGHSARNNLHTTVAPLGAGTATGTLTRAGTGAGPGAECLWKPRPSSRAVLVRADCAQACFSVTSTPVIVPRGPVTGEVSLTQWAWGWSLLTR